MRPRCQPRRGSGWRETGTSDPGLRDVWSELREWISSAETMMPEQDSWELVLPEFEGLGELGRMVNRSATRLECGGDNGGVVRELRLAVVLIDQSGLDIGH